MGCLHLKITVECSIAYPLVKQEYPGAIDRDTFPTWNLYTAKNIYSSNVLQLICGVDKWNLWLVILLMSYMLLQFDVYINIYSRQKLIIIIIIVIIFLLLLSSLPVRHWKAYTKGPSLYYYLMKHSRGVLLLCLLYFHLWPWSNSRSKARAQQQAGQQSRTNFAAGQRTSDTKFENNNHKLLTL